MFCLKKRMSFNSYKQKLYLGLGYFYGGMTRKKSLLTMLMSSGLAIAVVSFQVINQFS